MNPYLLIIILNVNGLKSITNQSNHQSKEIEWPKKFKKTKTESNLCDYETHFTLKDTHRLKVKR